MRMRLGIAAAAAMLLTFGCQSAVEPAVEPAGQAYPVVDTWPIGDEAVDCSEIRCDELVAAGLAGLAERDPGHAEVVEAKLHAGGSPTAPVTFSGVCCWVLVVDLADGSTRAIGVGYPGISDEPAAVPWLGRAP